MAMKDSEKAEFVRAARVALGGEETPFWEQVREELTRLDNAERPVVEARLTRQPD